MSAVDGGVPPDEAGAGEVERDQGRGELAEWEEGGAQVVLEAREGDLAGADGAAGLVLRLEHQDRGAGPRQVRGRREPVGAGSDDDDVGHAPAVPRRRRGRSRSATAPARRRIPSRALPAAAAPASPALRPRAAAYGLTWLSYGSYYLGRKGLPVAKATLEAALGKSALYGVETAYLAAYAVGLYGSGWFGDRVGARRLVASGMILSAAACFAFGASGTGAVFVAVWLVNGYAQSTGWPGNIKAMAEWTPPERRGAVMGIWSTCYQVGGIVATSAAVRFLKAWGRPWAFHGPALIMGAVGVLVLLFLRRGPLASPPAAPTAPTETAPAGEAASTALSAARRRLLRSPLIWSYGVAYFCLKLIRYSLLFWAPYYLKQVLGYETTLAADVATAFEWGGVAGAVTVGLLSDRLRRVPRAAIAAACLVGLAGAFWIYLGVGAGVVANVLGLALVGFLLFGPDSLVSATAAQDAGGPQAAALAAGLINGIGSVGAVFQEAVTRGASARWGWDGLFRVFVVLSLLAAVSLLPAMRRPAEAAAR